MDGLIAALFVLGLASGVHCIGMCGGIVSAFSMRRVIPINAPQAAPWRRLLAFNAGRISTYAALGAAAGLLGARLDALLDAQTALYLAVNAVLVLAGLHLAGMSGGLARLESFGAPLWRRLQPLASRVTSGSGAARAYAAGLVWGWLPCGLVYAALLAAAFAGSAQRGAAAMAAFGAGTLPFLLAAGFAAARLGPLLRRRGVRLAAGSGLLAFGVYGLAHAGGLAEGIRRGLLCL
jgi:sulfite exporter TauE/SafE